ncbi:MAG TPA: class I SAM-dependent methyltransferase [Candidatus Limnocylindrales bacterium]
MHDDADVYDTEVSGFRDDIPFWESVVDAVAPKAFLELACGTGRLLAPLARRVLARDPGARVVGVDISRPMLDRARDVIAADRVLASAVEIVEGDMATFELGRAFDLILIGFNSFAFLHDLDAQLACLERVRRHLAPGGVLGVDLIVPQVQWLAISEKVAPHRLEVDLRDPTPDIRRFLRFVTERYDPHRQVEDDLYTYEIEKMNGEVVRRTSDLAWSMVFPQQLELLFRASGLRVTERFGDYDRTPFSRRSRQYVWLAQPAT